MKKEKEGRITAWRIRSRKEVNKGGREKKIIF